jgi:hypothetical protein
LRKSLKEQTPFRLSQIKGPEVEREIDVLLIKMPREFCCQEKGWTACILLDYFSKKQLDVKEDTVCRLTLALTKNL